MKNLEEMYWYVLAEANRAERKHSGDSFMLSPEFPVDKFLSALVEEVGEAATEVYEDGDDDDLFSELVQVAFVALAWASRL